MIKNLFNGALKNFMILIFVFSIIISLLVNLGLNFTLYNKGLVGLKLGLNILLIFLILLVISIAYYKRNKILFLLNKNILRSENSPFFILLFAFIIRFLWISLIETTPTSDFLMMYNSAKEVFNGNFTCFHGVNYFARFSHDSITVLYYSLFYRFSENPLFLIKLANIFFSTLSVFMIYKIVKDLLNHKNALIASILFSLFPPFIMYNSQLLSENIAIPFYLISIYYFLKYTNNIKNCKLIVFSGLTLSIANLFRSVGIIFLIAYLMYLIIYKGFIISLKPISVTIITFIIPIYIISSLLVNNKIIETNLWNPKETILTSVLKGSNINSFGFWNKEDSDMPLKYNYDYNKVKEESIRLIKERLLHSPVKNVLALYIGKLTAQLTISDFGAFEFTILNSTPSIFTRTLKYFSFALLTLINIFHIFLLYFAIVYFKKNKKIPDKLNLFSILFIGFMFLYLILEVQPRYSFIICWTLIIFAICGLNRKLS